MTPGESQIVMGYVAGVPVQLHVVEIECGHLIRADLASQIQDAIASARADGLFVSISSAWRSMEKQEELYQGFKDGKLGFNPADRPGYSAHQAGTAIDLSFGSGGERETFAILAEAYGFSRPTHEAWHFVVGRQTPSPIPDEVA